MASAHDRSRLALSRRHVLAGASATAIQFWYRLQAHRGRIRRRQTASRLTTFAEAIASISLAATGAMIAAGMYLSVVPALVSFGAVAGAWVMSPARLSARPGAGG